MWADQFQVLSNPLDNEVTWFASGSLPTLLRSSTSDNFYSKTRLSVAAIDMYCNSGRLHVQTRLRVLALWPRNRDSIAAADGVFLFSKTLRPTLQSTQPYIHLVLGTLTPDVKWAGCEADHIVARLKNSWICTSAPRVPSWLASLYNYVSLLTSFFPLYEPIPESLYPQKRCSFHIVFSHVLAKNFLYVQPYLCTWT